MDKMTDINNPMRNKKGRTNLAKWIPEYGFTWMTAAITGHMMTRHR